jgi:heme/copper-type cytochrome/quinol oxidase subunit 2
MSPKRFFHNYREIFSEEGIIILYALLILATFTALRLDLLWPAAVRLFGREIPDFHLFGWMLNQVIGFLVIPIFMIFLFRERPRNYGWQTKQIKHFWWWVAGFCPVVVLGMYFVSQLEQFQNYYPIYRFGRANTFVFILYESAVVALLLSWEFFLRGFMLFGLEKKFGKTTVLIQLIPFVLMHSEKPALEIYSAIAGGFALGILGLRTRSFIPGLILHIVLLLSLDLWIVYA